MSSDGRSPREPEPSYPAPTDFLVQTSLAWTRTLWGRVLPDRRRRIAGPPPGVPERRR